MSTNSKPEKINVAVLFGGVSSEHEVSLMSASSILENLNRDRYNVFMVGITKEGKWLLYTGDPSRILDGTWSQAPENKQTFLSPDSSVHGLVCLEGTKAKFIHLDIVFPVLHGKNGEDGTLQGLLALSGIPYVGCDTLSSAVCMDKAVTHTLLAAANIEQTHYLWFYSDRFDVAPDIIKNKIKARFEFPVFVKPANAGSSVGVSKVNCEEELDDAIRKAALEDKKIVVEEGILGQEVEVAVMGNRDAEASVVGEIGTSATFYDYEDKYINGTSQLFIPARIDEDTAQTIREIAVRAYRLLGCAGLARVDFFVRESDKQVLLNEINTLPGFTSISMYPKLWMEGGMEYGKILDRLIDLGFRRK